MSPISTENGHVLLGLLGFILSPGGFVRISSDGDDRRIFWGLKFSIPRFFLEGKFGKYVFGWLDLSRDFLGYSKQSEDPW